MPNAPANRKTMSPNGTCREARDRDPGRHVADDGDAREPEGRARREPDPDDQRHEGTRDTWRDPPEDEDADDRADAERRRVSVEVVEAPDDGVDLLEDRAADGRDAEEGRDLADGDDHRQSDDEPGHHGRGQELRQEPEPGRAGDDQDRSDDERQRRHSGRRKCSASPAASAPTTDADMIATDELAVTFTWRDVPKTAYAVERGKGGDEAGLRGHARQPGICHRDRDHHSPADDPRDAVEPQIARGRRPAASGRSGRSAGSRCRRARRSARVGWSGPTGSAVIAGTWARIAACAEVTPIDPASRMEHLGRPPS